MGVLGHLSQARKDVKRLEDQMMGNLGILLDNLRVSIIDLILMNQKYFLIATLYLCIMLRS